MHTKQKEIATPQRSFRGFAQYCSLYKDLGSPQMLAGIGHSWKVDVQGLWQMVGLKATLRQCSLGQI